MLDCMANPITTRKYKEDNMPLRKKIPLKLFLKKFSSEATDVLLKFWIPKSNTMFAIRVRLSTK